MNAYFDIHGLFFIHIENLPKDTYSFLSDELGFFECGPGKTPDIHISFTSSIKLPQNTVRLLKDLYYCNGEAFLERNGRFLKYDLRDWLNAPIRVEVETGVPHWWVFYAIERTMFIYVAEKGYCMLHAGAFCRGGRAILVSGLQGGGKTLYVLDNCVSRGNDFLADDLVFIDADGSCLCYPRGINFNSFHGRHYMQAKKVFYHKKSILKRAAFMLKMWAYEIGYLMLGRKRNRPIFRLPVQAVYPDCKIVESAEVDELIIKFTVNDKCLFNDEWSKSRIVNFLRENMAYETKYKLEYYLAAIAAYGDEHSIQIRKTLTSLYEKQFVVISAFLDRVTIKFDTGFNLEVPH